MVHARNKGKDGELEWIKTFGILFKGRELKRNLDQTREGGADILGCEPFIVEVKRCEKLELDKWWRQVKAAEETLKSAHLAGPDSDQPFKRISVVSYRQNRGQWTFLLPASLMGIDTDSYVIAKLELFIKLVEMKL